MKSKKGSQFERDTCRVLSLWYSHGKRDDYFWRTAGSGARATVRMKQGKMTSDSAGDICALHPSAKELTKVCIFELKRGYSQKNRSAGISILTIVDKLQKEKEPVLLQWFKKLDKEMRQHKRKFGFIIFKRDRKNICIAFTEKTFVHLESRNVKKYCWPPFGPTATIYMKHRALHMMKLEDFLEWCEPETITRKIRRRQKGLTYEQNGFKATGRKIKRKT